jgi:hypothetical protein
LVILALLVAHNAYLLWPRFKALVLQYEDDPAARGRVLAGRLGCFNCHGPEGVGGVANPGSRWETVPGFGEQTLMMYAASDDEVREYPGRRAPKNAPTMRTRTDRARRCARRPIAASPPGGDGTVAHIRAASGCSPHPGAARRGAGGARTAACTVGEMVWAAAQSGISQGLHPRPSDTTRDLAR